MDDDMGKSPVSWETTEGWFLTDFSARITDMTACLALDDTPTNLRKEIAENKWINVQIIAGLIRIIGSEKKLDYVNDRAAEDFETTLKVFLGKDSQLAFSIATTLFLFTCGRKWLSSLGDLENQWKVWAYDIMVKRMTEVVAGGGEDDKRFVAERIDSILQRLDPDTMFPTITLNDEQIDRLSDLFEKSGLSLLASQVQEERRGKVTKELF